MAVGATNQITGIPSTAASLGVTTQPITSSSAAPATNSQVATGYSATPANTVTGGGTSNNLAVAMNNAAAATGGTVADVRAAHTAVSNQFGATMANDFVNASGGGAISDALNSGIARIAAFAQNGMKAIEQAIQGEMDATGQVDPVKMQKYTMQMSTLEQIMQMAAKLQEKQERAAQIWLNI